MSDRFEGKVVVVAGGATGAGAATSRRLASEGADVVVGDLNLAGAQATADAIAEAGGSAVAVAFDLGAEASIVELLDQAVDRFGGIDLLYNNAADLRTATFVNDSDAAAIDLDHWNHVFQVNLTGYMLTCRHAIPHMIERGGGAIVNTTSDLAFVMHSAHVAYSSSKLGVLALTRHIVARWGREGIRCNAVSPGAIGTESWFELQKTLFGEDFDAAAEGAKDSPSGRLLGADDIAGAVAFLLSDDAAGVNAQVLHVNGGAVLNW